jgi:hypothetical protein
MQPAGHELTWDEFKRALKNHHIPTGLVEWKMRVAGSQTGDGHYVSICIEI